MRTPTAPLRRTILIAITTLVAATVLSACAGGSGDDDQVLKVYSGRHYDVEKAFEQFQADTGIKVEFLTGNDAELRERIAAEGDETEADVYLTVDAGNLASAAEDGIFQPFQDPEELRKVIPANYRDPDDLWFGLAIRARTIIYNSDLLEEDEVPQTYEELADPKWKGKVCLRNANNPYNQSLVASMIAVDGREATLETVKGWADNAEIFGNDVELIEALGAGQCEVGIANHYYLARALEEDPDLPVDLIWANQDEQGTHINVSGGGVTKYADNPELAQQFLTWLATDGQSVLVDSNFEFPANESVEPAPFLVEEFGVDFKRQDVSASEYGLLNPEAVKVMDEAGFG
jgi:iron(III) transport system substrate-binding protein